MTVKKHKLSLGTEENHELVGISSHENDYRVTWAINQALGIQLARAGKLQVPAAKGDEILEFPAYQYDDGDNFVQYNLYANTSENGFLAKEMKNIDYLLKVKGEIEPSDIDDLVGKLRQHELISLAFRVELSSLKTRTKNILSR